MRPPPLACALVYDGPSRCRTHEQVELGHEVGAGGIGRNHNSVVPGLRGLMVTAVVVNREVIGMERRDGQRNAGAFHPPHPPHQPPPTRARRSPKRPKRTDRHHVDYFSGCKPRLHSTQQPVAGSGMRINGQLTATQQPTNARQRASPSPGRRARPESVCTPPYRVAVEGPKARPCR